ncbi:MAG: plastocyanin/azurin family copper-binding protein [Thaumarchaeota archaeon]|nr:plastocyanin/azurin family copper-binding protein [Nitrososphaerota archaeon]
MSEHENIGGQGKTVLVVLLIVAIIIPIALGTVLVKGLPYSLPTATQAATSTSAAGNTIYLPQGAGSAQQLNFSPASLTVASGATIMFVDQDSSAVHNVAFTSVPSGASTPAVSPNLSKGSTFNVTLTTSGTYKFECQYHSAWMQGTIVVTG